MPQVRRGGSLLFIVDTRGKSMGDGYTIAEASDAELLARLRSGETEAYTELWRRHVRAALRLAQRVAPGHAEDLVSESFLAVYRQVTTTGSGPRDTFRAYLFTVMRNTAMRWGNDGRLVETDPDIDDIELHDGLRSVEDRAEAAELLAAFEALPERWQRILWLAEVEEASRSEIAADLGIKPNAVSSLQRRARTGLRLQWLTRQVPVELRESPEHVARLLPALLLDRRSGGPTREIKQHLARCPACAEVQAELRSSSRSMHRGTLAVAGFAALGVSLPAAAQVPIAGAGTAALLAWAGGSGAAVAAGIGVLFAGGALTAAVLTGIGPQSAEATAEQHGTAQSAPESRGGASGSDAPERAGQSASPGAAVGETAQKPTVGRGNHDRAVPSIEFDLSGPPGTSYLPPTRPAPTDPASLPTPGGSPDTPLRSGLASPATSSGYTPPTLLGSTDPEATIAIEFQRRADEALPVSTEHHYTVTAEPSGAWRFDLRGVVPDAAGVYDYRVWAFTTAETSVADTGTFTLSPLGLAGFESLDPQELIPVGESSTTGIVFSLTGPANGVVCLTSVYSDQTAAIPLDADGVAVRRIRLLTGGTYYLSFAVCEAAYRGPSAIAFVDVADPDTPIFGPWGPDPAETVFELDEL